MRESGEQKLIEENRGVTPVSPMLEVKGCFVYSFRLCELDLPLSGKTAWGQLQYHLDRVLFFIFYLFIYFYFYFLFFLFFYFF